MDVDLKLAGKIVRFGRGMIGVVSERLFQDFAECLAAHLCGDADTATRGETDGTGESGEVAAGSRKSGGELSAVGLLLRALWSRLARLVGRSG